MKSTNFANISSNFDAIFEAIKGNKELKKEDKRMATCGVFMVKTFLLNQDRIADALEKIAVNTKDM